MVYSCGNGGSAAIANHLVCDCMKGVRTGSTLRPRVHSLSATIETITAIGNDIGYEEIFAFQLESLGKQDDVLIAISSSGDSPNIVNALVKAREIGITTVAMTGFSGGRASSLADISLHVMVDHEGQLRHLAQKPAWSPEFLLSTNYIVHFKIVRRSLLLSIGGLQNEIDNVQDLGVTCSLVAAGARVHHLSKPLYLWREHRASVALSTAAKAGIEDRLIQVYDRFLNQIGVQAKQTWPTKFSVTRTGVFQLDFNGDLPTVALVLISKGSGDAEASIKERVEPLLRPGVDLHILSLDSSGRDRVGIAIDSDAALLEFVKSLDSEVVAFSTTTAQYVGVDWLQRLA